MIAGLIELFCKLKVNDCLSLNINYVNIYYTYNLNEKINTLLVIRIRFNYNFFTYENIP